VREKRSNGGVTFEGDTRGGRDNAKGVKKVVV